MLTVQEAKQIVEEMEFLGIMKLAQAKCWCRVKGNNGLLVSLSLDVPTVEKDPGNESNCNISNWINFTNLGLDPNFTAQDFKMMIYGQMERFVLHELKEGFRVDGKPIVAPHGPDGEFL